jgi:hypothetical protein
MKNRRDLNPNREASTKNMLTSNSFAVMAKCTKATTALV